LIISYDDERGEPRGSRSRKADHKALALGDCIDCTLCVQVCPTGIDIRKGLQYECIGCAACIDVCDSVMDKMGYPRGLVRYATENGLAEHLSGGAVWRRVFRPRVLIYSAVLLLIIIGLATSLALRSPFRVDIVRDRSTLARLVDDGQIENVYRLQIMNSSENDSRYRVSIEGLPEIAIASRKEIAVGPAQAQWLTTAARISPAAALSAGPGAHAIVFKVELMVGDRVEAAINEKSTFVIPR
jgi:cytochrome c oxidase accessory protein FixG